ncbi:MAG: folylpolyglutamate synthase/dihydrofolate synthase family protein [Chthoniobacterales bacterium]
MNYRDALAWLYGSQTFGIKLGLDNTRRLLAAAGDPQERLPFLHVAGTNGKGSTCAMIDAMLRAAGRRTGLYTSPHLIDFRERLRLDGAMIPEVAAAEGLTLLREATQSWDHAPTFFEIATVLAAWWFDREGAEFVVWETGMGGRLDATNAVTPRVSVITPIGLDHQQWLGGTLAEIAAEKAGIIKPVIPVVSAPQRAEAREVLTSRAAKVGAPITFVTEPWSGEAPALVGSHQCWNAALACAALRAAGTGVDAEAEIKGLRSVVWPGRFQRVSEDLVIDGAHNPEAVEALVHAWRETYGNARASLVFGALQDKDASHLLRALRAIADEVWLVPVGNPRGAWPADLRPWAEAAQFTAVHDGSVEAALAAARATGRPVLVAGSLFLAGEVLALLQGSPVPAVSNQ